MSIYFISDIHLKEENIQLTEKFFYFLKKYAMNATALYVLGDLFDRWVGDDEQTSFQEQVITAIAEVTKRAIPVFFIHGNRDFLIGKRFARATDIQLLAEHSVVDHYGKKLLLMHGDTLCTRDIAYQQARKRFRHPLTKRLLLCMPLEWRKNLAKSLLKESKHHQRHTDLELLDADESAIQHVFAKYQVDYLIHGHTHQPSIQLYYDGASNDVTQNTTHNIRQRIVLSDWHTTAGNYLQLDAEGGFRLMYF